MLIIPALGHAQALPYLVHTGASSAEFRVCAFPANQDPCTNYATVYGNAAETDVLPNPYQSLLGGSLLIYLAPGTYQLQVNGEPQYNEIIVYTSGGSGANASLSNLASPTAINDTTLTFAGAAGMTAGGTNQNITLTPSGTGTVSMPSLTDSSLTAGNCIQAGTGGLLTSASAACGSGTSAFSSITTGTNTTATMTVGSGASIVPTGSGVIDATECNGGSCGSGGGLPTATQPGQAIASTAAGTTYATIGQVFYSQPSDTISSIESECSSVCTYISTIPQTFTLTANHTLIANVNVRFTGGGKWTVNGTGFTLTFAGSVDGTPDSAHFAGTASVAFDATTMIDYPQWFGAAMDGSTDDSTAIQDAINALGGNLAAPTGGHGAVQFLCGTYFIGTGLTINAGGMGLSGCPKEGTTITTSSATLVELDMGSASATVSTWTVGNFVKYITFQRSTTPTTGSIGVELNGTQSALVEYVHVWNAASGFYIANSGSSDVGGIMNSQALWNIASLTAIGFDVEEGSTATTPSMRFINVEAGVVPESLANSSIGFYATGLNIEDIHVQHFESAGTTYGVKIVATGDPNVLANEDDRFVDSVLDSCSTTCIYVSGMNGGNLGGPSVSFEGGWAADTGSGPIVDIESAYGVGVYDLQMYPGGSVPHSVYINGGGANTIDGNKIDNFSTVGQSDILVNNSQSNIINSNDLFTTGNTTGTAIAFTSSSNDVSIGNEIHGSFGTGYSFDSASAYNDYATNTMRSVTTLVSDSGTADVSIDATKSYPAVLYSTPASAGSTSLPATTMYTPSAASSYEVLFYADVTATGAGCTSPSTVALNVTWTDPNASAATTESAGTFSISSNLDLGTVGDSFSASLPMLRAAASTNIQYSTDYIGGAGCTSLPTVQVFPVLERLE